MRRIFVIGFVSVMILLGTSALAASGSVYVIHLSGAEVVPPVATDATGVCVGVLKADRSELEVVCNHDVAGVTAAHIHNSARGTNGPIVFPFSSPDSPLKGTMPMTPAALDALDNGELYVQVHSSTHPPGELRGQIPATPDPTGRVFPLQGDQEVPPLSSFRSGHCAGALSATNDYYVLGCSHDVGDATAAHIHRGAAGTNGPIVFFLESTTSFVSVVSANSIAEQIADSKIPDTMTVAGLLKDLHAGNLYVNVHSPANPPGELRGQIPRPPYVLYFPQFGNGGGLQSDVDVTGAFWQSSTTEDVTGVIRFFDADGAPLSVGIEDGSSSSVAVESEVDFTLNPLGKVSVATDGTGDLVQGSAVAIADAPIGGVVKFGIQGVGVAGVGSAVPAKAAIVPVLRNATINTGVAVRNTASMPIVLIMTLRDSDGVAVSDGLAVVPLGEGARLSMFISELFPSADTEDFSGSLVIRVESGSFSAIGLQLGFAGPGLFTTLPVTPIR